MPVYRSIIEVQFECSTEDERRSTENGLALHTWKADGEPGVFDITAVRVHVATEDHIEFLGNQIEVGVQVVDDTGQDQCGCQEIMSPVPGVLFVGEVGTEVQRCDTHRPEPNFDTDEDAARHLETWGVQTERRVRDDGDGRGWDGLGFFITDLGDFEVGQSAISFPAPNSTPES